MMSEQSPSVPFRETFKHENTRFAEAVKTMTAGETVTPHHVVGEGLWFSLEPDKGAQMEIGAGESGMKLHLQDAGRARWLSLSFDIAREGLKNGPYLGLLITTASEGLFSYRPCLRYLMAEGFVDQFAEDYVLSTGGETTRLSHIPIDPETLDTALGAEVHIFFQGQEFEAELIRLEAFILT